MTSPNPSDQQLTIDPETETWDEWFNHLPAYAGHDQPTTQPALDLLSEEDSRPT